MRAFSESMFGNLHVFTHRWIGMFQEITTGISERGSSMSNGFVT